MSKARAKACGVRDSEAMSFDGQDETVPYTQNKNFKQTKLRLMSWQFNKYSVGL